MTPRRDDPIELAAWAVLALLTLAGLIAALALWG